MTIYGYKLRAVFKKNNNTYCIGILGQDGPGCINGRMPGGRRLKGGMTIGGGMPILGGMLNVGGMPMEEGMTIDGGKLIDRPLMGVGTDGGNPKSEFPSEQRSGIPISSFMLGDMARICCAISITCFISRS